MSSLGESGGGFAAGHDDGQRGSGGSVYGFDGDGECFRLDALGQREEHDRGGAVGFGAEESGGDGRAGGGNQPQLIALALGQGTQTAGDEDQRTAGCLINDVARGPLGTAR